jgi:hypothetical protein
LIAPHGAAIGRSTSSAGVNQSVQAAKQSNQNDDGMRIPIIHKRIKLKLLNNEVDQ